VSSGVANAVSKQIPKPNVLQMLNWPQITAFIEVNPGLSAAMAGMVLSAGYVLLMYSTKLGDIKPGVQAFVLSALIHLTMAAFWGSLAVPDRLAADAGGETALEEELSVPIRKVVVDDEEATPDQNGGGQSSVFNRLPTTQKEEFDRKQETVADSVVLENPERTPETMTPEQGPVPDLPQEKDVTEAAPEPAQIAEPTKRDAADAKVEIAEETSESRPEVLLSNTSPSREVASRKGTESADVQREVRPGQLLDAKVTVQMSKQPVVGRDLVDENSTVRRPTEVKVTPRKAGASPNVVEFNDPGTQEGQSDRDVPVTPKFVRVGPSTTRSSEQSTVERKRVLEFPRGNDQSAQRQVASLSPGMSRNTGSETERPTLARPSFNTIPQRPGAFKPEAYKLRNLRQRQMVALKHGATQESERAVELSLQWLARHQNPEGFWDADGFDAQCPAGDRCWGKAGRGNPAEVDRVNAPHDRIALETAGQQADTGLTALVVLTFLGAGYTQEEGQYADNVDRAIRWMIRQQTSDGYLGGHASHYERMYCHGMVTYALGEACGMMLIAERDDPQLRQALNKGVQYIVSMQNPRDGGWRYLDGHIAKQESDMSMFGWQLMALKSAEIAGIPIPDATRDGLERFLTKICQGPRKGLASYRLGEKPKPSMTAEALFCRQVMGVRRNTPSSEEAIEFLAQFPPKPEGQDLYYWYYGTLAIYQYGGEPWARWNGQIRDTFVATQKKTGHAAGSWDPRDNWSRHGGRLYSTALSTLCLEVYYRFLPLYQEHDRKLEPRPAPVSVD
jgi:hypothetical protein